MCGSIADIVTRRAAGRQVRTIHLRVGQLRQVVPDTLAYCWTMVVAETELAGTVLQTDTVAARVRCHGCGQDSEMGQFPAFACHACHSFDVAVVAGDEFLITSLELSEV